MAKWCNFFDMWCREVRKEHGEDYKDICGGEGCNDNCNEFEEVES